MLAWMLYVVMVSLLLSGAAFLAERAARLKRASTRWIWMTAIVASLVLPTLVSSVAFELPDVLGERVASRIVTLREATSTHLSPAMWIAGVGEPAGWRVANGSIKQLWLGVSAAMALALLASGVQLFVRKRRWHRGTVAGASVYVTSDVGPAVVGFLRPRIVVPRWLTEARASHQEAVLAHEQAHLDARDPQLFTLALALLVFMPWNLPLWWQLRRLRYAIEIDCDARVLERGLDPASYGETLIVVGERQSAYIGAVAAMSESKSFLEERIEHMFKRPVRWRRLGTATLASLSVAMTALAAQVSPPNAASPAPVAARSAPTGRAEVKLPTAVLDRYVGTYQVADTQLLTIRRAGDGLEAQLTGQGPAAIYATSETAFFYKIVSATLDFAADGSTVRLRQGGADLTFPRIDSASVAQLRANLDARIAANTPSPGSEAALLKLATAFAGRSPNYEDMEPEFAAAVRQQIDRLAPALSSLGDVKSVQFERVGDGGWDVYRVKYTSGSLLWRIGLSPNGKVAYALALPDA
jgi:beta-lactamase regulating signal transducer with metallopeptidase domain